ncbi:J-domain-containing protein [Lacisediminihabitans changchengi]|uniref:DUF1992 domain-containing protein n=1 Tax=Lacisediminihabitans changchengi TaxID=2787634 RepID=A0A934SN92_9MICO|nr:DUF1992 domain-containing protein [Lacisediminihabitans changchengi]MBK4348658.1 DUF1992 domain-containing protein [Lacisediminihabitans changchengi]
MADPTPRDSRLNAARYRVDGSTPSDEVPEEEKDVAGQTRMDARSQYVEIQLQQAMRRGDFDDLPGAGKPIPDLHEAYDPNWWIRRKIERERLTGLGPPALTLRTENASLDAQLDALASERQVREVLDDFNSRIVAARRQLQGGPPVVTPPRDVDATIAAWRHRRETRQRELADAQEQARAALAAMSWRERRRARRGGSTA